jgi:hypothetical protein
MTKYLAIEGQNGLLANICSTLGVPGLNLGLKNGCNYWGFLQSVSQRKEMLIFKLFHYRLLAHSF